jgi:hypothetical protein
MSEESTSPTPEQIAEFEAYVRQTTTVPEWTPYDQRREMEYPPFTDYLDAVVKGDQAQMQAYIDACLAVKAKYPKPTA